MVFTEIEKLCEHIMQDDSISKTDCETKSSSIYKIYNGLCKTEGMMTGTLFAQIMKDKHKVSIIID